MEHFGDIVTIIITAVSWLVIVTVVIVRIAVKLKDAEKELGFLTARLDACQARRDTTQDAINETLADIRKDLGVITERVSWMVDEMKSGKNK